MTVPQPEPVGNDMDGLMSNDAKAYLLGRDSFRRRRPTVEPR
jgi:hypothetical protein